MYCEQKKKHRRFFVWKRNRMMMAKNEWKKTGNIRNIICIQKYLIYVGVRQKMGLTHLINLN